MSAIARRISHFFFVSGLALGAVFVNGCDSLYWGESTSRERVQKQGTLTVLTTKDPLVYSRDRAHDAYGIDHDLLEDFSANANVKLRYRFYKNEAEIMAALARGEGDIAAARLRPSDGSRFLQGPAYEETHLSLFCRTKLKIANINDLKGLKVAMLAQDDSASFSKRLQKWAPQTEVVILANQRPNHALKAVQEKKFDCAVTEDVSGRLASRYLPQVELITEIGEEYNLHWLLAPHHHDLKVLMMSWFQQASRNDDIMRVMDRYQTYVDTLDNSDLRRFRQNIFDLLPQFRQFFADAAEDYDLPWQLIASVAYQESHWNPEAVSFTGVRGMMQLTTETALHLGITDRMDPEQSIQGGTKYLRYLFDKTPAFVNSKDRLALTLAAYNIGYGHLRDAQKLAEKMGRNPYSWRHLRKILPLLEEPRYAEQLEFGLARGQETVDFVERVKSFYNYMVVKN